MRKQLAIGVSLLALTALGGASENSVSIYPQREHSQYTHFVNTNLNQSFEPMSGASLEVGLPNRLSFQTASVQFITGGQGLEFGNMDFVDPTIDQCKRYGYSLTSCSAGQLQGLKCPYNSAYFDRCCDSRYKYDKSACNYPNTVSGDSCGGKYMCYCDRALYPYENCPSPQVTSGGSCTEEGKTYYEQCTCPSNYNQKCDGLNQQGSGTGCTYNGTTKYTSCQCKSGYNMTCSELGPVTPSDYCLLNGIKYYNNCKTCEFKCTLDSCPEGVLCEYEDCSQKYCDIGCATNYIYWCTMPETDCETLGYTKTAADCSSDNSIKCPYDANKLFCLKEEKKIQEGDILYGDGSTSSELIAGKQPIGVVFDVENRLALALTDAKQNGSSGSEGMLWSSQVGDIPELENCPYAAYDYSCGSDGQNNTEIIISSTQCGITYAANAAHNYAPNGCSATFCQKYKWFLPSKKELESILRIYEEVIQKKLEILSSKGATTLQEIRTDCDYWTSTEYRDGNNIWSVGLSSDVWSSSKKNNTYSKECVRPVVKF